ncbi:MAG: kinase [Polyangiales bacterium]
MHDPAAITARVRPALEALAARVTRWAAARGKLVVGIAGGQGTGKSTLATLLCTLLSEEHGLRSVVLSLDDYYLSKAERAGLAREVHPLLATRGVPGTHDAVALRRTIQQLRAAGAGEPVSLLQFSKAHDDRELTPRIVRGPFDVVLFEGWCVGARPQSDAALAVPVNTLEADEDHDAVFRRYVNTQLQTSYAGLFAELDQLVFLVPETPGMASVHAFRAEQEQKLAAAHSGGSALMDATQLARFIAHFERLTLHMQHTTPSHADGVLTISADRQVSVLLRR